MFFTFHSISGIFAAILSFIAFIPYIIATLKGINRPNRASWIIWTLMGALFLASYKAAGATDSLWLSFANVLASGFVLILAFRYGAGGWTALDLFCLFASLIGVFLWWYFSSPLTTLYLSMGIDFIGAIPTIKKSYVNPEGEDFKTWIIFWMANSLNLFSIQEWNFAMAAYPLYLFLISGTIALVLVFRSRFDLWKMTKQVL